jgi:hypothetical protein
LIVTSRTPKVPPEYAAKQFRDRVCARLVPGNQAGTNRYRPKSTGVGLALVVLIGLTTLAVAWVSIWWMSVYLALMVLILVAPHGHRQPNWLSKPAKESTSSVLTEVDRDLRVDRTEEADHLHLATEYCSSPVISESNTNLGIPNLDLTSSGPAKPRRSRGRARKVAKAAAEPGPDAASVTWIRVGPGKFIRADAHLQATDQTQTEEVIEEAHSRSDAPAPESLAPLALVNTLVKHNLFEPPGKTPGEEQKVVVSGDYAVESAVEVYGITPSAFSSIQPDSLSVKGLKHNASDVVVTPEADSIALANLGSNTSGDAKDGGQLGLQGGTSGSRVFRVSRGLAHAIPSVNRASLRRNVQRGPKPRTLVWSSDPLNVRFRQAAHRTIGRFSHVQRTLRPRSPPTH